MEMRAVRGQSDAMYVPKRSRSIESNEPDEEEGKDKESREDRENRSFLAGLVESQQLAPAIKAIYDRHWLDSYRDMLQQSVQTKDHKVKAICDEHYEEFIQSFDSLLTMKMDVHELKQNVVELNDRVQGSGKYLISKSESLMDTRFLLDELLSCLDTLHGCQYVLGLASKAVQQLELRKYFSALKTLDQLQRVHLPRFHAYEFCRQLGEEIPRMRDRIQESVKAEFTTWLSSIRDRSRVLGQLAMSQMADLLKVEMSRERERRSRYMTSAETQLERARLMGLLGAGSGVAGVGLLASSGGPLTGPDGEIVSIVGLEDDSWDQEGLFDRANINFAPVYQCLHMYENLDSTDEFRSLYKERRRAHALQTVEMPPMTSKEFVTHHQTYFQQLAGFFILEDAILKSGNELMARTEVESLWEMAVSKIQGLFGEHMTYLADVDAFLAMKHSLVVFAKTLESYGIVIAPLLDFIASRQDLFENLLMARLKVEVKQCFSNERFESLRVVDYEEYKDKVLQYELQDPAMHVEFPTIMPFSLCVPALCAMLRRFVVDYHQFAFQVADMDTMALRCVNTALCREVNPAFTHAIEHSPSLHISQAVQFSINAAYLAHRVCPWLEKFTLGEVKSAPNVSRESSLSAAQLFSVTRVRCEDLMLELVDAKIDAFMSLASGVNWLPSTVQSEPSDYVQDLLLFLEETFAWMHFMPDAILEAVHFTSCKHICAAILGILMDQVKKFNILALYNLHVDVSRLEEFAHSRPVPNLAETFSELRQLLNLFLGGNPEEILDVEIRQSKYDHLAPAKLKVILEKFKDLGVFGQLPKGVPKIKKKQLDSIIKRLK